VGPFGGYGRNRVEVLQVHETTDGFVVVTAHEDCPQFTRSLDDLVRAGAVSDDVAQIHHQVMGGGGGQTCLESLEVAVDIAEQKNAHRQAIIDLGASTGTLTDGA